MKKKTLNENILGFFPDKSSIQQCVTRLLNLDFSASNISVELSHPENKASKIIIFGLEKKTMALESAIVAASIGAGLGATLGALLNLRLSLEVYTSVILGFFIGAILGAVVGMMIGRKVQENDESEAARKLEADEALITVRVSDEEHAELAQNILIAAGARIQVVQKDQYETIIPTYL